MTRPVRVSAQGQRSVLQVLGGQPRRPGGSCDIGFAGRAACAASAGRSRKSVTPSLAGYHQQLSSLGAATACNLSRLWEPASSSHGGAAHRGACAHPCVSGAAGGRAASAFSVCFGGELHGLRSSCRRRPHHAAATGTATAHAGRQPGYRQPSPPAPLFPFAGRRSSMSARLCWGGMPRPCSRRAPARRQPRTRAPWQRSWDPATSSSVRQRRVQGGAAPAGTGRG
jgi:hypothetical protein